MLMCWVGVRVVILLFIAFIFVIYKVVRGGGLKSGGLTDPVIV